MATLKEEARAYEPKLMKNISELDKIPVNAELKTDHAVDDKGENYEFKYIEVNNDKYRIPGSVIGGIKALIQKLPNTEYISVIRTGTGLNTRYQVFPWQQQ